MPNSVHALIASADPDDLPHDPAYEDLRRSPVLGFARLDQSSQRMVGLAKSGLTTGCTVFRRSCRAPAAVVFRPRAALLGLAAAAGLSRPALPGRGTSHE
jgi:hypothetical protein